MHVVCAACVLFDGPKVPIAPVSRAGEQKCLVVVAVQGSLHCCQGCKEFDAFTNEAALLGVDAEVIYAV